MAEPRKIGVYDAKTHLSRYLDEVAEGVSFLITRGGKPVAELRPVGDVERAARRAAIARLRELRERVALPHDDTKTLRELIEEGRRF
ncbi:MAG TPA: type II toxin-antitoxin system prevent-host-death family antitoxin [Candidatus Dormibacteraeota bacterium]|nr:type II toxin-antitoxin system prevent-host-death family antitoxin [Candidatus Dormibacteraeota bacterium]